MRASNVTMGSIDICVKRVGGGRGEVGAHKSHIPR